jgi:hypothetical protein
MSYKGQRLVSYIEELWHTSGLQRMPPTYIGLLGGGDVIISYCVSGALRSYVGLEGRTPCLDILDNVITGAVIAGEVSFAS